MKKVLIITYYWPPSAGSGVQRWMKFAKYLPSFNWQPVIYTPENPDFDIKDESLNEEISKDTIVIKTKIFEPYGLYRKIRGFFRKKDTGKINPITAKSSGIDKLFLFIRGNFFIPDPRISWKNKSVRFLKQYLEENPADLIISTGPPHSMHMIAAELSEMLHIPWIADFRDPWTKIFYFKHLPLTKHSYRRYVAMEKRVLDGASAITTVSPLDRRDFQQMTSTPVYLLTNGYDECDFDQVVEQDGYFNVTYTGLFVADANPEIVWKVLGDKAVREPDFLKSLRIRLVGKVDEEILKSIRKNGLEDNLILPGYKKHRFAVREQMNASLLLLPSRNEPEAETIIPGKFFEYLASSNPILGISSPCGAMAEILNTTKNGKVFAWDDEDGVKNFIDDVWMKFNSLENIGSLSDTTVFSRKNITGQLVRIMNDITKGYDRQ